MLWRSCCARYDRAMLNTGRNFGGWLPVLAMLGLTACSWLGLDKSASTPATTTRPVGIPQPDPLRGINAAAPRPYDFSQDPTDLSSSDPVINLLMYQMQVPSGVVTHSKVFWKHLDEDSVDVAAYQLLYKNGIRLGRGRIDQWPFFKQILDQDTISCKQTLIKGLSGQDVAVNMTEPMPEQTLFVFTDQAEPLTGRMFDECVNQFTIGFQWAPHKQDTLRVKICPDVLTVRKFTNFQLHLEGDEASATIPEQLYDLRLCADIAPGEFLVIAPSPSADDPNRVGHRFLMQDKPGERYEQVLVLCQQRVSFDKAKNPATRPAK